MRKGTIFLPQVLLLFTNATNKRYNHGGCCGLLVLECGDGYYDKDSVSGGVEEGGGRWLGWWCGFAEGWGDVDLTVSAGSVPPGGWGREQWSRQWRVRGRRWRWRWRRWWCGGGGAGGRGRLVGAPVEQSAASSTHLTQLACSVDASESRELKWREAASGWWAEKKKKEAANANPPLRWTTSFSCCTETCERAVRHTIGVYS